MLQTWLLRIGLYLFKKPRFRKWANLEDRKYEILKAIEQAAPDTPEKFSAYFSIALFVKVDFNKVYWKDTISAFSKIHSITVPDAFLPLVSHHSEAKNEKDTWDYPGRLWYFYSNILAKAYGWTIKVIANLRVQDALAYIQEVLTDQQLEREFIWSTSEIAYPYNKSTKKSKFSPLRRPYWMLADISKKKEVKSVRILKSLLPVGTIQKVNVEAKKAEPE